MRNRMRCALAFAGFAVLAVAAPAERRPLWTYHNGNTLFASPQAYQRGYAVGVMDGYLIAHQRRLEHGEAPDWLDLCLSAGRPAPALTDELLSHLGRSFAEFDKPAAEILLEYMRRACGEAMQRETAAG